MRYGRFDNDKKEYVIENVNLPVSWTNYLGVKDTCVVINHTAGGYMFYKSPEYHRVTRFRGNAIPMDRPGHYVYLRDNDDGDYWSISWQPVGKPLDRALYTCRHGLSYSVFECKYKETEASQTMFVPLDDDCVLWDVKVKNTSERERNLSVFSYAEFSYHSVMIDNINHQMSLYCAGSSYADGVIEHELFYEDDYQYFTSNFEPDGYECLRDKFIGPYRTETNPIAVESGIMNSSHELGGNHCAGLKKDIILKPGEEKRLIFILGEGPRENGIRAKKLYSNTENVDKAFRELSLYWDKKCRKLQISTPNEGMDTLINIWTLYQSEVNVMFSRFASFIEVGGRVGLGYRDTAQDAMTIPHSNPDKCRQRIIELLRGLSSEGYGLHLFEPEWFEPKNEEEEEFLSPTVIPGSEQAKRIHTAEQACSDDALWLIPSILEYIKETGDLSFADKIVTYCNGGAGTVYEHMKKILDFSDRMVGQTGICKGLRADWNDCLNLGGGESALVSFLHYRAISAFLELAEKLGRTDDINTYTAMLKKVKEVCDKELWDGEWFIRGITKDGRRIGTKNDEEGKVHLESNAWAVLSGAEVNEKGRKAMDAVDKWLFTDYGLMLNAPSYTKRDPSIGFITRVYPGIKENGAVFSHPNPWAWAAECMLGRGDRAMKFYNALCPYYQNDMIEIRESEPYSYCQFIMGKDHSAHGRARHPFMTGSGGWAYFSATRYILGIRPQFDELVIDPCVPSDWKEFSITRIWRDVCYNIHVENPDGVMKGVKEIYMDGVKVSKIPAGKAGETHNIKVYMG